MMIQPLFIGTTELVVIAGVILLLFGGKKGKKVRSVTVTGYPAKYVNFENAPQ